MARWMTPTLEQEADLAEWVAGRPPHVRAIFERLSVYELYRMRSTGHRVTLYAVAGNGTVTVNVTGKYNALLFDRQVFGIDPDDLEPCELPEADEPVGAAMTPEEVLDNIDLIRLRLRPDLWVLDADGVAVRRR